MQSFQDPDKCAWHATVTKNLGVTPEALVVEDGDGVEEGVGGGSSFPLSLNAVVPL